MTPDALLYRRSIVSSLSSPSWLRTLARHDSTLAGALGITILAVSLQAGNSLVQAVAAGALSLPLAWRSRWPLAVLGVVAVASLVYGLIKQNPAFVASLAVALYAVAVNGSRWRTVAVAAGLVPYVCLLLLVFSPDSGSTFAQTRELLTELGLALAVGEAVRSGRALFAAMRERVEQTQREHELEAQRRVNEERVRIARDVHDVVSHSLATISTQASVGVHVGRRDPERGIEVLESIRDVSVEALQDLRRALGAVRDDATSAPTAPAPSLRDVPALVDQVRDSGLEVVLRMEGAQSGLSSTLQVAAFRVVQEGLTNVMRHAHGAHATVRVAVGGGQVEVDVRDDGRGAPTASSHAQPGSGLIGMQERVGALGGTLHAGRARDGGFEVRAVLPREGRSV